MVSFGASFGACIGVSEGIRIGLRVVPGTSGGFRGIKVAGLMAPGGEWLQAVRGPM